MLYIFMASGIKKSHIFVAAILLLLVFIFQKPLRASSSYITSPIGTFFNSVNSFFRSWGEYLVNTRKFQNENENLKLKILELEQKASSLEDTAKENNDLRSALNLALEKKFNLVFVKSIVSSPSQDAITINKGEKDGVVDGMAVITPQNVLVGKVFKVYSQSSDVMLLCNPKMPFYNGKISGTSTEVVLRGEGNGNIRLEYIATGQEIKENDILSSSLTGGIFPEGLLIGEVKEVHQSDTAPIPQVSIKPYFDFKFSENLFLIFPK